MEFYGELAAGLVTLRTALIAKHHSARTQHRLDALTTHKMSVGAALAQTRTLQSITEDLAEMDPGEARSIATADMFGRQIDLAAQLEELSRIALSLVRRPGTSAASWRVPATVVRLEYRAPDDAETGSSELRGAG